MHAAPWHPPAQTEPLPAGRWWDAVRVPKQLADLALESLGDDSGAVISDGSQRCWWLVPVGSAEEWTLPGVTVLTETEHEVTYLGVPPKDAPEGPGPHWRRPFRPDRYLADASRLHDALTEAARTAAEAEAEAGQETGQDRELRCADVMERMGRA